MCIKYITTRNHNTTEFYNQIKNKICEELEMFHSSFRIKPDNETCWIDFYDIQTQKKRTPTKKNINNHVLMLTPDLLAISIMLWKVDFSLTVVFWNVSFKLLTVSLLPLISSPIFKERCFKAFNLLPITLICSELWDSN